MRGALKERAQKKEQSEIGDADEDVKNGEDGDKDGDVKKGEDGDKDGDVKMADAA